MSSISDPEFYTRDAIIGETQLLSIVVIRLFLRLWVLMSVYLTPYYRTGKQYAREWIKIIPWRHYLDSIGSLHPTFRLSIETMFGSMATPEPVAAQVDDEIKTVTAELAEVEAKIAALSQNEH